MVKKINQSECIIPGPVFSKYMTGLLLSFYTRFLISNSCNKFPISQTCSILYWKNFYQLSVVSVPTLQLAHVMLTRPWADTLPVRPSCLVNKIYVDILVSTIQYFGVERCSMTVTIVLLRSHQTDINFDLYTQDSLTVNTWTGIFSWITICSILDWKSATLSCFLEI